MARNGSGSYSAPASSFPVVSGTLIEATKFNNTINDIASALTQSISNDGQTPILANIPMGGFKLTGLAAGIASGQSVEFGQLSTYAPLASPVLTGNPTAPTPATGDNDTSIATTAFVKAQAYATLASPALTGNPTAPTPTPGDNDTSISTTAFVTTAVTNAVVGLAPIASPTFTGTPAAPTPAAGDNDTSIATTAFVCTGGWVESSEITLVASTILSFTHSIGRIPSQRYVFLRCKTADFGYAVGDEVDFQTFSGSTYYIPPSVCSTSTEILCPIGSQVAIMNRSTSIYTNITLANWKLVFRCR